MGSRTSSLGLASLLLLAIIQYCSPTDEANQDSCILDTQKGTDPDIYMSGNVAHPVLLRKMVCRMLSCRPRSGFPRRYRIQYSFALIHTRRGELCVVCALRTILTGLSCRLTLDSLTGSARTSFVIYSEKNSIPDSRAETVVPADNGWTRLAWTKRRDSPGECECGSKNTTHHKKLFAALGWTLLWRTCVIVVGSTLSCLLLGKPSSSFGSLW